MEERLKGNLDKITFLLTIIQTIIITDSRIVVISFRGRWFALGVCSPGPGFIDRARRNVDNRALRA